MMARTVGTQPSAYNLKVTLSGGTSSVVTTVRVVNRRTGEFRDVTASSNTAIVNFADLSSDGRGTGTFSGFVNGDEFEIRCFGGRYGSGKYTVAFTTSKFGGAVTVTVADVSSTTNPGLNV